MKRTASAEWNGNLKSGSGRISSASGVLKDVRYGFRDRFEDGPGTNPEELVAAAHAACFSMALSADLEKNGLTPESVRTRAELTLEKLESGWTTTGIRLVVNARVPGAEPAGFQKVAESAKQNCPISRLLNTTITLEATLEP